jgi:exopolysaccharide biosynthesis operon protein EpsL
MRGTSCELFAAGPLYQLGITHFPEALLNGSARPKILTLIPALAVAAGAAPAKAQIKLDESLLWNQRLYEVESARERDRPLELRVYGGLKYDSNLFRISDQADAQAVIGSSKKSDTIYNVGVGGSYEIRPSRQKILLEGAVEQNWYQRFDDLDNTANHGRAEWGWQAGNDWFGTLGIAHRHYLENYASVQSNIRDMVDRDRAYGSANYQPLSYLRFTADLDWTKADHSADARQILDFRSTGAAFTTSWVTPSKNSVGVKFRTEDTTYPNGAFGTNSDTDYRDYEYSLVSVWNVTAASRLEGRLGHTERKFDQDASRDFSGPTWRLGYQWEPTGKTALEVAVWRELTGFEDLSGTYMRTNGIGIFPAWSVMPKLVLQGMAAYQTRDYVGDFALTTSGSQREDQERLLQVAAVWTPLRLTKLVFALESGDRNSNQAFADYDYYSAAFTAIRSF